MPDLPSRDTAREMAEILITAIKCTEPSGYQPMHALKLKALTEPANPTSSSARIGNLFRGDDES